MQPPALVSLDQKYTKIRVIGKGAFGEALLVRNKEDRRRYVAKEINLATLSTKEREEARHEILILGRLDHPNIVKLHESLIHRNRMYIVMEYADGGDLGARIKAARTTHTYLPESQVLTWFAQLCLALKHIHDKKILHRDLKVQNIFLTSNNIIKLGDFGISTILRNTLAQAMTVCGTPYYFSPEICNNKPYNNKSDIWALGCVLHEMLTLQHAFNGRNIYELMKSICSGKYLPIPSHYSREVHLLLPKMLHVHPSMRLSIDGLLRLDFVQECLRQCTQSLRPPLTQVPSTAASSASGASSAARTPNAASNIKDVQPLPGSSGALDALGAGGGALAPKLRDGRGSGAGLGGLGIGAGGGGGPSELQLREREIREKERERLREKEKERQQLQALQEKEKELQQQLRMAKDAKEREREFRELEREKMALRERERQRERELIEEKIAADARSRGLALQAQAKKEEEFLLQQRAEYWERRREAERNRLRQKAQGDVGRAAALEELKAVVYGGAAPLPPIGGSGGGDDKHDGVLAGPSNQ